MVLFEFVWPTTTFVLLLLAHDCTGQVKASAWVVLSPFILEAPVSKSNSIKQLGFMPWWAVLYRIDIICILHYIIWYYIILYIYIHIYIYIFYMASFSIFGAFFPDVWQPGLGFFPLAHLGPLPEAHLVVRGSSDRSRQPGPELQPNQVPPRDLQRWDPWDIWEGYRKFLGTLTVIFFRSKV